MKEPDLSFFNSRAYKVTLSVSMAIFFFAFMVFFLPFGVSNYDPHHEYTGEFLGAMALFTAITLTVSLLNELVLRPRIFQTVTYPRIILWSIWTFILLGVINFFIYNLLGNWHDFHWVSALSFILNCSTVLVFPILGTFFFFRYRSLQQEFFSEVTLRNSQIDPAQLLNFEGQGANDRIALAMSDFLYGQAQDNYVELNYLAHEKLSRMLIRASLSRLTDTIGNRAIVRCHRSYLVNLYQVRSVTRDSQGYKLLLRHTDTPVPVSKSYQEEVIGLLRQVRNLA